MAIIGVCRHALVEPTFRLTKDQTNKTEFYIDRSRAVPVDAIAADSTTLVIPIANDATFVPAAMSGNALFIEVGGIMSESPLMGSGKVITQIGAYAMAGIKGS